MKLEQKGFDVYRAKPFLFCLQIKKLKGCGLAQHRRQQFH